MTQVNETYEQQRLYQQCGKECAKECQEHLNKNPNVTTNTTTTEKTSMKDNVKQKLGNRYNMNDLLRQSRLTLQHFFNTDLPLQEQFPYKILNDCQGIGILTVTKGGFGVGGALGSGIIIGKGTYATKGWSGPMAIGLANMQWGFSVGIEKVEYLLIFRDYEIIRNFLSKGELKFGTDVHLGVGPRGRDATFDLTTQDKGYAPILLYAMSKGIFIDSSLQGYSIDCICECNENFYGQKVDWKSILDGTIRPPVNEDYNCVVHIFDEYIKREGKSIQDLLILKD